MRHCHRFLAFSLMGLALNGTLSARDDLASRQRGAAFFMNYCAGCHSLKYLRYNRMATDLGLTTPDGRVDRDLLVNNLMFTSSTMDDPIQVSLPPADARQWFGRMPPDLSLTARERGSHWISTYLKSFYVDSTRPFGANNLLIPDVAMPDVLAPLRGQVMMAGDHQTLSVMEAGAMSPIQFNQSIDDVVAFLTYVSDPIKATRIRLGWWVLSFLGVCLGVFYRLKKEIQKTVVSRR